MLLSTEHLHDIVEAAKAAALALRDANEAYETDENYLQLELNHPEYCKVIDCVIDLEDLLTESQAELYPMAKDNPEALIETAA
tara:strand:+ start:12583 stop:12831 length:249 start_codon:yes stop_codon:yes gene_type:complete